MKRIWNSEGLCVTSDISSDIAGDMMDRQWTRRTAGVPRGLLRLLVLKLLNAKPMSGAEIVEEIERETGGRWKPSSGSIYPLLAWLQEKNYTNEAPTVESGMKRYVLTAEGFTFFQEQVKFGRKFLEKLEYLAPMFIGGFQFGINSQNLHIVEASGKRLIKTLIALRATLTNHLVKHDADEIAEILNRCAEQLERITQRIKGKDSA